MSIGTGTIRYISLPPDAGGVFLLSHPGRQRESSGTGFEHYTREHLFTPWVTSLLDNHYHVLGYCKLGEMLGPMMRKIHGSAAKLTNDLLPERLVPFWREAGHQDYFDGCIRDEKQCKLAYRYTLTQSVRHGICADWREYPHTHINIELERGLRRALELEAFMPNVPYRRYQKQTKR